MESIRAEAERPPSDQLPSQVEGMLDLNLLPERYRPSRPSAVTVAAWALTAVLAGLLIVSYPRFVGASAALRAQQAELAIVNAELAEVGSPPVQIETLEAQIQAGEAENAELRTALQALTIQHFSWGRLLQGVLARAPEGALVGAIQQEGLQVRIVGTTDRYLAPLEFAERLSLMEGFHSAVVVSIERAAPDALQEGQLPPEVSAEELARAADDLQLTGIQYAYEIVAYASGLISQSLQDGQEGGP